MPSYVAGSVSAKIELDTTDFDKKIEGLKGKVDDLKVALQKNGLADVSKQLKKFQETIETQQEAIDKLKETMADYKKQLKSLRTELNDLSKGIKKGETNVDNAKKKFDDLDRSVVKVDKSTHLFRKNFESIRDATYLGKQIAEFKQIEKSANNAANAVSKMTGRRSIAKEMGWGKGDDSKSGVGTNSEVFGLPVKALEELNDIGFELGKKALQDYLKEWSNASIVVKRSSAEIQNAIAKFAGFKTTGNTTALNQFQRELTELASKIKQAGQEYNRFEKETSQRIKAFDNMASYNENWEKLNNTFTKVQERVKYVHTGLNQLTQSFVKTTEVLEKFNFKLLEGIDRESIFYQRTVELASAMHKLNSGVGTRGADTAYGGKPYNYSQYVANIDEITKKVDPAKAKLNELNSVQKKLGSQSTETASKVRQLAKSLEMDKATNSLRRGMQYVNKETLRARYGVDTFGKGVKVAGEYTRITSKDFDDMGKRLQNTGKNSDQANAGIRKTGTSMVNAANSSRILSNTLYQLRGALLSLKMIFTAMGGMALWGFATEIAEGIKTTFTAKNEM